MTTAPDNGGAPFEIGLPSLGLQVTAVPRWSKPVEESGSWRCGAEIALSGAEATSQWHRIVDALL